MKKIALCLVAMALLACTACKKNPAEEFEGNYSVATTVHLTYNLPVVGDQTYDNDMGTQDATVALDGDDGGVIVTIDQMTAKGTVDEEGMHLNPSTATMEVDVLGMAIPVEVTFKYPTIKAPVNGKMTWKSDLNAVISYNGVTLTANGTADHVAVKK